LGTDTTPAWDDPAPIDAMFTSCGAENLGCSALTKTYWAHERPTRCGRSAQQRYGSETLCWQHVEGAKRELRYAQWLAKEAKAKEEAAKPKKQRRRKTETIWVYFIQVVPDGPIKIGSALDPPSRLKELQTGSPHWLDLLAVSTKFTEREYHERFAEHCIRGEWYRPVPSILERVRIEGGREAIPFKLPARPWVKDEPRSDTYLSAQYLAARAAS
jgi:hypothetical protein